MEIELSGVVVADFLAALDLDDIQPDDPTALDCQQIMGLMGVTTVRSARDKADKAVEAGRLECFKTRRRGRIVQVYKVVASSPDN